MKAKYLEELMLWIARELKSIKPRIYIITIIKSNDSAVYKHNCCGMKLIASRGII